MPSADLYLDRIDFSQYISESECRACGYASCSEFIEAIRRGEAGAHDCFFIRRNRIDAIRATERIKTLWPDVPLLMHPRVGYTGILELNSPCPDSLVLLTGNNEYTQQVLLTVLGTTLCPFFVLCVDTDGNTVDMAMVYGTLTAERIAQAIEETKMSRKVAIKEVIVPGLAEPLEEDIARVTGWRVRVGPVCAAELPLYLSDVWVSPGYSSGQ